MRPISLARSLQAGGTPAYAAASAGLRRARMSSSFVFFANGFVVASWLPHIPEVKERLALGDFLLGIALFSMAVGSVLVLPVAGRSAERFGSDTTTRAAGLALCLLLPTPVVAPNLPTLILALLLFGAANGMLDVSMNAQAVLIEDRHTAWTYTWTTSGEVQSLTRTGHEIAHVMRRAGLTHGGWSAALHVRRRRLQPRSGAARPCSAARATAWR